MNVKKEYLGKKVIFGGNEVVLSDDLANETKDDMARSGLSLYFEPGKNPAKVKPTKPANIVNPKKDAESSKESGDAASGSEGDK